MIAPLLFAAALGAARGPKTTPAFDRCMAQNASTYGMLDCISAELKVEDARLNAAYRKAQAGLNARQKAKLQAGQRAWVSFRDAGCSSLEDEGWGSLSRINASMCVLGRTTARAQELETYPDTDFFR